MSVTELVKRLTARRAAQVQTYRDVVVAAADGRNLDAEDVERVLVANGATAESFQADVQRLVMRRSLVKSVEAANACAAHRESINQQLRAAQQVFDQAQAVYDEASNAAAFELEKVKAVERAASVARQSLIDTADPKLIQRLRVAEAHLGQAQHAVGELDTTIGRAEAKQESLQKLVNDAEIGRARIDPTAPTPAERVKTLQAEIDDAHGKLPAARKALEAAKREYDEATAAVMAP